MGAFSEVVDFLIFLTCPVRKPYFGGPEGGIFASFSYLFLDLLREGLRRRFWEDLGAILGSILASFRRPFPAYFQVRF